MAGVPTGPRAIPTGPRSTVALGGSTGNGPSYVQQATTFAHQPPPASVVAVPQPTQVIPQTAAAVVAGPPAPVGLVPQMVPTGPAAGTTTTPALAAVHAADPNSSSSSSGGGVHSPRATSSPAKRPLEEDDGGRRSRHASVDRPTTVHQVAGAGVAGSGGGEQRLSMRNEPPLAKRPRADSPVVLGGGGGPANVNIKREASPMVVGGAPLHPAAPSHHHPHQQPQQQPTFHHRLPDNKPSPSQRATLGWFVGLLPPAAMFDGPFPFPFPLPSLSIRAVEGGLLYDPLKNRGS